MESEVARNRIAKDPSTIARRSLFDASNECFGFPALGTEADVGGIGILIGFTITAGLAVVLAFLRWACEKRIDYHSASRLQLEKAGTSTKILQMTQDAIYRLQSWKRVLNRNLLFLTDLQLVSTIALLLTSLVRVNDLSAYHLTLAYKLMGFLDSAIVVTIIFVANEMPDRDMNVRQAMLLGYQVAHVPFKVLSNKRYDELWFQEPEENSFCYISKELWISYDFDNGRTSSAVGYAWWASAATCQLYVTMRRKGGFIRFLGLALRRVKQLLAVFGFGSKLGTRRTGTCQCSYRMALFSHRGECQSCLITSTGGTDHTGGCHRNASASRRRGLDSRLSRRLRQQTSRAFTWIHRVFLRSGGGVLLVGILFFAWAAYDVWGGIWHPNRILMERSAGKLVPQGSDLEWGFGQVLALVLTVGQCILQFYQAYSERVKLEWKLERSIRRLYVEYGLIHPDEDPRREDDIYIWTILSAIIQKGKVEREEVFLSRRYSSSSSGYEESTRSLKSELWMSELAPHQSKLVHRGTV
ncbi:hypothetical protein BJ508DRAFT_338069 [Ascobolus immersus RN42]|uniref:Uncharacterized protein n=1 Tax=Ascobolus immersus RN42 TaxID=1160509 RepID=A0A3N4HSW8_ASCIM|nr:hypothetical protein BJ508DRAFT_338069 [Ascobolus immersus RN42]